jgi:hypothetical protein
VLAVCEPGGDRAGEELADRFSESAFARAHDQQPRIDLLRELLHRHRGVADQLPNAPLDLMSVEDLRRFGFDEREIALARGDVDVDRCGVDVAVRILIRDEARHIDVHDQQRRVQNLRVSGGFLQHAGRKARHHPDDDRTAQGGRLSIGDRAVGYVIHHAGSPFQAGSERPFIRGSVLS